MFPRLALYLAGQGPQAALYAQLRDEGSRMEVLKSVCAEPQVTWQVAEEERQVLDSR